MAITADQVKELRDRTGISVMQCRKALEDAGGDLEKAVEILKKKGAEIAAKKADRNLGAGVVAAYIHGNGNVGAMVELASETDFVSNNQEFKALAYDLAMQVAATNPEAVSKEQNKDAEKDALLMEQAFIKDPSVTVAGLIQNATQKFGEKIEIVRFSRFSTQD